MIKVVFNATCNSETVPGRSVSNYSSTPIPEPTQANILKVVNNHVREIEYMISTFGINTLQFSITLVNE